MTKNSEQKERLDYHGLSKFLDNLKALFAFKADTPVKLSQLENDVGYKTTDTVYTHPSYAAKSTGLYKVSVDGGGHVNSTAEVTKDDITKLGILSETPSFNDAVSTYTTLSDANAAAQTSSDAIKSGVSIFATLSNMKKSFSAIVQGLKILGTNVGMIQGITSDLNAESDYIAASSKALHTLNSNLGGFSVKSAMGSEIRDANAAEMGIYHIGERMPNSAFNFWSTIIATSFRNGWTQQICFPWSSNEKRIAYRLKNADGWQSWHYINFDN